MLRWKVEDSGSEEALAKEGRELPRLGGKEAEPSRFTGTSCSHIIAKQ